MSQTGPRTPARASSTSCESPRSPLAGAMAKRVLVTGMCAPHRLEAAMSHEPDWNPDILLAGAVRKAAKAADDASAAISRAVRTDVELPADISEVELVRYRLERELRDARDRIRALEGAIKTTAKVLAPYAGGNSR